MSGIWGTKVKFSIFGESHGNAIGIVIDGLPSGITLDLEEINHEMSRRAPGKNEFSTPRKEEDKFEILSGFFNNNTTGTPLCAIIKNTNTISKDYSILKDIMRPGHADYTGNIKYKGFNDYRGGGHFSGRLTAPLVFAGAVSKQILKKEGIEIVSHIYSIADVYDTGFDMADIKKDTIEALKTSKFPVIDTNMADEMKKRILEAKENQDSVGGIIEAAIINLPPGLGDPYFNSVESSLSQLLFSIPGLKAVEFGAGFQISKMRGSEANDELIIKDNKIKTVTNNNGGLLGGITNGMPIVFRCAFKPTASIAKLQKTINISTMENTNLSVHGRHDPCIVVRAIPVVEAAAAMSILNFLL